MKVNNKKSFYLIGKNIKTSFSPLLHNKLFQLKHQPILPQKTNQPVQSSNSFTPSDYHYYSLYQQSTLPSYSTLIQDINLKGMSITIPFKNKYHQMYINYLQNHRYNKMSNNIEKYKYRLTLQGQFASKSKIINTLIKLPVNKENTSINKNATNKDNMSKNQQVGTETVEFVGYNTDIFGINKVLEPIHTYPERFGHLKNILVLGAGATSQTFCHYFQQLPSCQTIYIANRSPDKIQNLSKFYNKVKNYTQYSVSYQQNGKANKSTNNKNSINFIVNTLPSQVISDDCEAYAKIIEGAYLGHIQGYTQYLGFMDVNYRIKLPLIQKMIKSKHPSVSIVKYDGLDMLIWQAIEQNRLFCHHHMIGLQGKVQEDGAKQLEYFRILKELIKV